MVIELEVEFIALYKNQPLFGEIDAYLSSRGFVLFDLANLLMLKRGQYGFNSERKGQIIAGDALYFRTPENLAALAQGMQIEQTFHLLAQYCAVCAVYGYRNLALEALQLFQGLKLLGSLEFEKISAALGAPEGRSSSHWPGQGRISGWLRRLTEKIEPRRDSIWINNIGND